MFCEDICLEPVIAPSLLKNVVVAKTVDNRFCIEFCICESSYSTRMESADAESASESAPARKKVKLSLKAGSCLFSEPIADEAMAEMLRGSGLVTLLDLLLGLPKRSNNGEEHGIMHVLTTLFLKIYWNSVL